MHPDNFRILDWQANANFPEAEDLIRPLVPALSEDSGLDAYFQLKENAKIEWAPNLGKWELLDNDWLYYPGLPAMEPVAFAMLRNEKILVYQGNFLCVLQPNGNFSVGRMK